MSCSKWTVAITSAAGLMSKKMWINRQEFVTALYAKYNNVSLEYLNTTTGSVCD